MCRRTTCETCQKPSWTGCGAHVEQILGDVAVQDRCSCSEDDKVVAPNFLQRLLSRG